MRSIPFMLSTLAVLAACTTKEARRTDTTSPATATLAGTPTPNVTAVRQAIDSAEARQREAVLHGDSLGAITMYADDAIVMMPGSKIATDHAAIIKTFNNMMAGVRVTAFTNHVEDLLVTGDYAIETATYDMTLQPKKGKPVHDTGKYLTVWKKQSDGSYKAIRDINNSDK
jgi:ketosteroid isomerase-like protein